MCQTLLLMAHERLFRDSWTDIYILDSCMLIEMCLRKIYTQEHKLTNIVA